MNIRKLFFSFLFLIASFILIDNVSAETLIFDYENSNLDLLKDNLSIVEEIRELSNDFNINNYTYYISYNKKSGVYYLTFGIGNYSCLNAFYTVYYSFNNDRDLYNGEFNYLNGDNIFCDDYIGKGTQQNYIELNLSNYDESTKNEFLNNVKNYFVNGASSFSSMQSQTYQYKSNLNVFSNNNFSVPVYSNANLKFVKKYNDTKNYEKIIQIGDNLYNYNDIIPTYYDYFELSIPKTPTIDVNIIDKEKTTINNVDYVSKKNIKLNLNNFDFTKHQLYLAFDYPRGFCEYLPDFLTSSYSFDVTKNTNIYAKIVDRETQEELYTTSINITDISVPIPNIDVSIIETEYLNNDTSLPALSKTVQFNFDYFNTDIYSYKYYDLDYDTVVNILENNHIANTHTNGNFIIYVYDKQTNELVNSSTLTITGLFGSLFPQISIKHNSYDYKYCGDEKRVYSQTLDITFSILDSTRYIYEYSIDNVNYIEYDIKNYVAGYYFEYTIFKNSTLYVRIKDKNTNEILDYKEFIVDSITFNSEDITCILGTDFNSNLSALQEYLVELKETSNAFNQIFNSFYKSLPTVVSQGLAYAYIIILVIVGLKLGGWK